jgi:hypothetical protein
MQTIEWILVPDVNQRCSNAASDARFPLKFAPFCRRHAKVS